MFKKGRPEYYGGRTIHSDKTENLLTVSIAILKPIGDRKFRLIFWSREGFYRVMFIAVDKGLALRFASTAVAVPRFNKARAEYNGSHTIDGYEGKCLGHCYH